MRRIVRAGLGVLLALAVTGTAFAASNDGGSAQSPVPLSGTVTGKVMGSQAGAYSYYTFNYPGNGSTDTVSLSFGPADPATANAVGLNVYQGGTLLGTTNGIGNPPGTVDVSFASTTAGPILVQVYNYNPGEGISYQLSLAGATSASTVAPAATVATAKASTGSESNPASLAQPVSATLAGNVAGSYTYYTYNYAGDNSTQTVTLDFSPTGADVANALYLNVYQNGTLLSTGQGTDAATPGRLSVQFSSTTAGPILVQVANYNPAETIGYTISH